MAALIVLAGIAGVVVAFAIGLGSTRNGPREIPRGPRETRSAPALRDAPGPTKGDANPGGNPRVVQGSAKRRPRMLCHVGARGERGAQKVRRNLQEREA
jgi:hypothetical protein